MTNRRQASRAALIVLFALFALSFMGSGVARAYDKDAADAPGWRYEIQPYALIPLGIKGNATVLDRSVPVDVTAGDLFSKLKLAAMARFEAWKGPWGIVADGAFTRLADSKSRPELTFDLKSTTWVGQAMGAYRGGWWHGAARQPSFALDVMLGGQIAHLRETLDIDMLSRSTGRTFWKVLGEARPIFRISPDWAVVGRILVGVPDFLLSTGAAVEYDVSRFAIRLGYGYDKIKYSSSSGPLTLDVWTHGPFLALGIRFGAGPTF